MQAHFLALQGLSKLLETVQMVREGINDRLIVAGVVLCMHEGQTILASEVAGDCAASGGRRGSDEPWNQAVVFDPPIRRNIKLAEAPSFGQPIFEYCRRLPRRRRLRQTRRGHHGESGGGVRI